MLNTGYKQCLIIKGMKCINDSHMVNVSMLIIIGFYCSYDYNTVRL
jgi:hypothetical protein